MEYQSRWICFLAAILHALAGSNFWMVARKRFEPFADRRVYPELIMTRKVK